MAVFPQNPRIKPQYGYDTTPIENVKRTSAEAGNSFTRDVWSIDRFRAGMDFLLQQPDAALLWAWWKANRSQPSFTFYDYGKTTESLLQIDTGDGTKDTFVLPGKEAEALDLAIFVAGVQQLTLTLNRDAGPLGEDTVTLPGVPLNGEAVVFSGTLRRRYTCEFASTPTRRHIDHARVLISMDIRQKFPIVGLG